MKLVYAWTFLVLYMVASVRPLMPIIDYQINRDFFVEVLCINKSKPALNCNGTCALTKKIEKAYQDETQPVSTPKSVRLDDYPIGFISMSINPIRYSERLSASYPTIVTQNIIQGHLSDILRPPCIS